MINNIPKFKKNQIVYAMEDGKPTQFKFVKYWRPDLDKNQIEFLAHHSCQVIDEHGDDWTMNDMNLFETADELLNAHIDGLIEELANYIKMLGTIK